MATKAQIRANNKYRDKAYDRIEITVPKGDRDRWKAVAESKGMSLTAYILALMEADNGPLPPLSDS